MNHKVGEESNTTEQIHLNKINGNEASNHESMTEFKKTKLEMMTDLGDYRNSKVAKTAIMNFELLLWLRNLLLWLLTHLCLAGLHHCSSDYSLNPRLIINNCFCYIHCLPLALDQSLFFCLGLLCYFIIRNR